MKKKLPRSGAIVDSGVLQPESRNLGKQRAWDHRVLELISALPQELKNQAIQDIDTWKAGYHAPFKALKAWSTVALGFTALNKFPNKEFFEFLFHLIARHAAFANRTQINRFGWRADCLKGMLMRLERATKGDGQCTRERMTQFISWLVEQAQPMANGKLSPLAKVSFSSGAENLVASVGAFLKAGSQRKSEGFGDVPEELWNLAQYVKRLPHVTAMAEAFVHRALWLDLKLQSTLMSGTEPRLKKRYYCVRYFLFYIGDAEWCKLADQRFRLFTWHASLIEEGAKLDRHLASRRRRPSKRRRLTVDFPDRKNDIFWRTVATPRGIDVNLSR